MAEPEVWLLDAGRRWLGKVHKADEAGVVLKPAYSVIGGDLAMDGRGGGGMTNLVVAPLHGIASADELQVDGGAWTDLATLDAVDRAHFGRLIEQAEQMRKQIRAARSGIALASR